MDEAFIITCAITGAETTKEHNPNLPVSPEEQALAAKACVEAGASVIHLHVRDDAGKPSQDTERFKQVADLIKKECDVILQFSTGGAVGESTTRRLAPLILRPEMASLNVGSINFGDEVFVNLPKDVALLAAEMKRLEIKPEIEVYDIGMLEYGVSLVTKDLIASPAHFQFVMGTKFGISANRDNLEFMRAKLPPGSTFAVAGIGRFQLEMVAPALELGGHVRCGFEDNIYLSKGVLADSNAVLVDQVAHIAKRLGKRPATVAEARKILCLKS
jgi:3-keto-5-aminohexanoate cleavage enzyme